MAVQGPSVLYRGNGSGVWRPGTRGRWVRALLAMGPGGGPVICCTPRGPGTLGPWEGYSDGSQAPSSHFLFPFSPFLWSLSLLSPSLVSSNSSSSSLAPPTLSDPSQCPSRALHYGWNSLFTSNTPLCTEGSAEQSGTGLDFAPKPSCVPLPQGGPLQAPGPQGTQLWEVALSAPRACCPRLPGPSRLPAPSRVSRGQPSASLSSQHKVMAFHGGDSAPLCKEKDISFCLGLAGEGERLWARETTGRTP